MSADSVKIKCLDGEVSCPISLFNKSEKLKGPGGTTIGLDTNDFKAIIKATEGYPLPDNIPKEILYSYFPFTKPADLLEEEKANIDAKKQEEMRYQEKVAIYKMNRIRSMVEDFNVGLFSCCLSKKAIHDIGVSKVEFLSKLKEISKAESVEKLFRKFNKVNKNALLEFERKEQLLTKLFNKFFPDEVIPISKKLVTTLTQRV